MIIIPVSSITTVDVFVAGEYRVTVVRELRGAVKSQKSPPHWATA